MRNIFFAVQETREDAWDYGSESLVKAVEMLKEQDNGLITVIDVDDSFALDEMTLKDLKDLKDEELEEIEANIKN